MNIQNIENLDPKTNVAFFDKIHNEQLENSNAVPHICNNDVIWTIDNFLTKLECDQIIQACENAKFDDVSYRDSKRLLCFDKNGLLIQLIQKRLHNDAFIDRLNMRKWKVPYGFGSDRIEWYKNTDKINECLRIHKYESSKGFEWHRDAQYTESSIVRSNYTLLIYLNDNFKNGETVFCANNNVVHNGLSVSEELKFGNTNLLSIKPEIGMAVVFDQRLLHMAKSVIGTKYVLRTDLLCHGTKLDKKGSKLEQKIELLSRQLFRQAQYMESLNNQTQENIKLCGELYEKCLSLRQDPSKINSYPAHLEKLINDVNIEIHLTDTLKLVSRSGKSYKFTYTTVNHKFELLKIASIFSILSNTKSIGDHDLNEQFMKIMKYLNYDAKYNKNIWDFKETKKQKTKNNVYDTDDEDMDDEENIECFNSKVMEYIAKKGFAVNKFDLSAKIKPLSVILEMNANNYGVEPDGHCGLCDRDNFGRENNNTYYKEPNFKFNIGEFMMKLNNIDFQKDTTTGTINVTSIADSFNHASCQCDRIVVFGDKYKVYKTISYDINFVMGNTNIVIDCNPLVIM